MCNSYKARITTTILSNDMIANNVFKMTLKVPEIVSESKPGQFVNLYINDPSKLLPRPISICEIDETNGLLTLVYAIFGEGTRLISGYKAGESIDVMGPFGNGYTLKSGTQLLVGGGVGTPPLVETAKQLKGDVVAVIGFRTGSYLIEELKQYATVYVATDDGSVGSKGTVIDVLNAEGITADHLYACGPTPMLRALQTWANDKEIDTQLSLEERMGCGFGACVGCVVKVQADNDEGFIYEKVCKDGPVFDSKEVIL